ncbi:hypothetical protein CFREN_04150 [Corynebacterium freneyi]|nr:hypothetical protein CFREN_04150 [Corynebacterium freneyi]
MQGLMGEQSQLDAANQIGISKSNITRWKDGARAAPDFVVKVARAYGANVLEALVEAEFITEKEAKLQQVRTGTPLEEATNQQILREILRRSGPEATYLFGMGDEQINPDADVLDLPRRSDDTPAIRAVSDDDLPYVADSSPDHPEEDIEFDD